MKGDERGCRRVPRPQERDASTLYICVPSSHEIVNPDNDLTFTVSAEQSICSSGTLMPVRRQKGDGMSTANCSFQQESGTGAHRLPGCG
eukprot:5478278-Pleurochrysis_carterae.AAC.2